VGLGKKEKKLILVLGNIAFHCHIFRASVEMFLKMILAPTRGVFLRQVLSLDFELRINVNHKQKSP
jgi:hypothetical protein